MPQDPLLKGGTVEFHGPSPILGPDGQPYRRAITPGDVSLLGEEVAAPQLTGVRQFYDPSIATGLTPGRLAVILRECVRGDVRAYLQLAEDMEERDLGYAAALGTRKRALSRIRPTLDASGVEPKVAAAVREVIEDDAFHSMIKDALDALGKGFSVNEIVWGMKDGLWWPWGYRFRDPKFFTFDYVSRSELRLADYELMDGYEMPPAKFIRHIPKMKSGIPIRGGLARTVAWAWMFKSFTLKDWAAFLDVYGMPMRLGKYHPAATAPEKSALLRAVAQIASDAAAIIPESMNVEFIETKVGSDKPFETFATYLDDAIATLVLGQTLTTRDGGSLGQAKVHNEVRLDLAEDDAFELGVTINRELIRWFVDLNFGTDVRAPKCEFRVPKPEQVSVISTALGILVPLGLEVGQEDVRAAIGMPTPAPKDRLLASSASAAPPTFPEPEGDAGMPGEVPLHALNAARPALAVALPRSSRNTLRLDPAPASRGSVEILDPLGFDGASDWQAETGPMLDAIMAAADRATSFEDFKAALKTLYGDLPSTDFDRRMAVALQRPARAARRPPMADDKGAAPSAPDSFSRPPPEVQRYFDAKGIRPTFHWLDVAFDEHAMAFTVARSAGYDILGDVRQALSAAIDGRQDFETFRQSLEPMLKAKGWWGHKEGVDPETGETVTSELGSTRRLATIYNANVRTAYAAGQWERAWRTRRVLPHLLYLISVAEHKRPLHLEWVGTVLPIDHPWWDTHYPPNGWNCQCRVRQISDVEAKRRGYDPDVEPPDDGFSQFFNKRSGEYVKVPRGIDPGWAQNPGKTRTANAADLLAGRLDDAPAEARRVAVEDIVADPIVKRIAEGRTGFDPTNREDQGNVARGRIAMPVAVLTPEWRAAVDAETSVVRLSVADGAKQAAKRRTKGGEPETVEGPKVAAEPGRPAAAPEPPIGGAASPPRQHDGDKPEAARPAAPGRLSVTPPDYAKV